MSNLLRQALVTLVFGSFVSLSVAAPAQSENRLTSGLRNAASPTAAHTPQPTPAHIAVEAKILRVPSGSMGAFSASYPNPLVTGVLTPEQLATALKSIVGHQQGEVIYDRKFVTSNGRGITVSAAEVGANEPKHKGEAFDLWFTPVIEGRSVQLFAGIPPEGSKTAAALAFEKQSHGPIPNTHSLIFHTRDNSQPEGPHYLIILTPTIQAK